MTKYNSPLNYPSCAHIELEKEQSTVTRIIIVINNHKKESKQSSTAAATKIVAVGQQFMMIDM